MNDYQIEQAKRATREWAKEHAPYGEGLKNDNVARRARIKGIFLSVEYSGLDNAREWEESTSDRRRETREDAELKFLKRWARGITLKRDDSPAPEPRVPSAKRPSNAERAAWREKNPEAFARYVIDQQILETYERSLRRAEAQAPENREQLDGTDGGYAQRVGVKKAAILTARRLQRERVEDNAIFRAEHDGVGEREHDETKFDAAVEAALLRNVNRDRALRLRHMVVLLNGLIDESGYSLEDAHAITLRAMTDLDNNGWAPARDEADYLDGFFSRTGESTETALRRLACEDGVTVEFARSQLADALRPVKPYLAECGGGRVPTCVIRGRDFGANLLDSPVYGMNEVPNGGRPRQHDGEVVRVAVMHAVAVARRMTTGNMVNGGASGVICTGAVAIDLYLSSREFAWRPTFAQVLAAVDSTRLGTSYSLKNLTRRAAASAYDLPVVAMAGLERALA